MKELPPIIIDTDNFLRHHYTLPALPTVVTRLQGIIHKPDIDMVEVGRLIGSDPAMVAQILKVVNSGYYGLPQEVTRIQYAVNFLGLNEIYRMVLSISVINTLSIAEAKELSDFWYHSFYTALATKLVAKRYDPRQMLDDLWSSAILHDIGKLVYLKFFPEHYRALHSYCRENGCLFVDAEQHFEMPSSTYLGSLLCEHWLLPFKIKEACKHHTLHDLEQLKPEMPTSAFLRMICLGNLIAILANDPLSEENKKRIADAIQTSLGCAEAEFLQIMAEVCDLRPEVERFMQSAT